MMLQKGMVQYQKSFMRSVPYNFDLLWKYSYGNLVADLSGK
jgi:hypothetical protein